MVMAAIRIKILHSAITIACCRNRNRSIVIAAPTITNVASCSLLADIIYE
jgi:hypothetical protein